ncbi:MAG: HAD hydrolase-like protein [Oscillospiraceae bacterium]|nr:HAD hydrolase-like protein [Oscillospiraceae bacterium]
MEDYTLRFDAILFDVDGTLVHSSPGILGTMEYTFRTMGVDPAQLDLNRYIGPPLRKTFMEVFGDEAKAEQAVDTYRAYYKVWGQHQCTLFPGVEEMLKTLKAHGTVLCTATCKPVPVVTPILKELGIAGYFDVVGGATMDERVDDKPSVIRSVLEQPVTGGRRILMVGDRADDLLGAGANALPAAGVLYGYGSREELERCDHVFMAEDCEALVQYILSDQ